MAAPGERQRTKPVYIGLLIVLILVIAGLIGLQLRNNEDLLSSAQRVFGGGDRFTADTERLDKLRDAPLVMAEMAPVAVGEWPQWRGPRREGLSLENGLLSDWPKTGPPVLWKAAAGAGFSSMAVAGGKVYTLLQDGPNEAAVCWNADTGKEVWRFGYPCQYQNSYGSGPRATPTVDGDRVYTVGGTGILHCLQAATGEKLWRHDLLEEFRASNLQWGVSFSPLVEGGLVFTNPGGPGGNSIAAFDKQTGKLVWKALDDQAGYSSPIAFTLAGVRQILFFTEKGLVSVAPADGQVYWRFPWETSYGCNVATPIVVGKYVFISSNYGKGCALLEIVGEKGSFQAKSVYEHNQMRNHFSSSIYYKDHIYGFDDSTLICMDFRTGKVNWKEKGFKKGSLLIADQHLIILGEAGKLALAEATADGYHEQAAFQVSREKCWTVPVLAGGRLYVRDEKQVVCLDLRKGERKTVSRKDAEKAPAAQTKKAP